MTATRTPARYAGLAGVAGWLDMTTVALAKAMQRHPTWPAPDAEITPGRSPDHPERGWSEKRRPAWEAWRASLPGRGAGGGRPRKDTILLEVAAKAALAKRHDFAGSSCDAERCREANGWQCAACGHYFARSAVTGTTDGEYYCRAFKGHNAARGT